MSGLARLLARPLMQTMWQRRTHRVSRGVKLIKAGSMTYESTQEPEPLSALEEAVLIAATGHTGLTMPDRPFQDPATGKVIMAKPNLTMDGRTAGSPDNSQGTHFLMINDTGTYYLRRLPSAPPGTELTEALLLERAAATKQIVLDHRIDVRGARDFPAYLDSNRFLSNVPGTTIFFPVVDLSHQYINGLMYLLTQPDGARPAIVDDRNFYMSAGVGKWVKNGFLNKDIKVPLGVIGTLAHADRGRSAAAEHLPRRRGDGTRRLDPRQHLAPGADGRSEIRAAIRADAWLRLRDAPVPPSRRAALAGAAAQSRQSPRPSGRPQGGRGLRHPRQVPALLRLHVGGGGRRREGRSSALAGSIRTRRRSGASTRPTTASATSRRRAPTAMT